MSKNILQVYTDNPIVTNQPNDLMYFGRSPYGTGDDTAMRYSDFAAQFTGNVIPSIQGTANQVLVNGTSGVPVSGTPVTLTTPQDIAPTSSPTFVNLTLTTGNIFDANANIGFQFNHVASAVNFISVTNQSTGATPGFVAAGSDTDVNFGFITKANGIYRFNTLNSSGFRFETGTAYQHLTTFSFPNTAQSRTATWQDSNGTVAWLSDVAGTVTSAQGTANQVLVNGTSGTPQTGAVTLTTPQDIATTSSPTFNNTTLTGGLIFDANGNEAFGMSGFASAVNYVNVGNSAAAAPVFIQALGGDPNIAIQYVTKGIGSHNFYTEATSGQMLFLTGPAFNHSTQFNFPNSAAARVVTWQDASGTVAYLSDVAGTVTSITGTANQVLANGTSGSAQTGAVTLTTPQDIATTSNVQFATVLTNNVQMTFNGAPILSSDGAAALNIFISGGTSVNAAGVAGSPAGVPPAIFMSGADTDIGIRFLLKAAGQFQINTTNNSPISIASGTGQQHVTTFTMPNTAASRTYTWPDASGTVALTAGSGGLKSFTVLTSGTAATYTTPAGITSLLVEVLGPGGGGGGATGGVSTISQGAGGGSGGYARLWIPTAAASYTYTVGTGGAAGTAGGGSGGTGTTTTFSASSLQATSGTGGVGMGAISIAGGSAVIAGNPGVGSNGDVNTHGNQGLFGFVAFGVINGGNGGSTYFGGGGYTTAVGTVQAPTFGGGGAGGSSSTVNAAGGAGAGGLIIVWEFA